MNVFANVPIVKIIAGFVTCVATCVYITDYTLLWYILVHSSPWHTGQQL